MIRLKYLCLASIIIVLIFCLILISSYVSRPYLYFWTIESNCKTVFMLGTVHSFKPEFEKEIDKKIMHAFDECDLILIERIDTTTEGQFYPHGDSLVNHIPEEYYNQLKELISNLDLRIEDYILYRPGYFEQRMRLISAAVYQYEDYYYDGLDFYFLNKAKGRSDKVHYDALELCNYYAEFIEEELPENVLGYYLVQEITSWLSEGENIKRRMDSVIQAWLNSSIENYLENYSSNGKESLSETEEELKEVLSVKLKSVRKNRNILMADRIEEFINSDAYKSIFAMAGALHFLGEDSIIDILKERGYKVKRIKKSFSWPFRL